MPEYADTHELETIVLDCPKKDDDHVPILDRKSKREPLMDDELTVFSNMTRVVKDVASTIRESKLVNVHPDLYIAVMDQGGFISEALMNALRHVLDNRSQGVELVAMADTTRCSFSGPGWASTSTSDASGGGEGVHDPRWR